MCARVWLGIHISLIPKLEHLNQCNSTCFISRQHQAQKMPTVVSTGLNQIVIIATRKKNNLGSGGL